MSVPASDGRNKTSNIEATIAVILMEALSQIRFIKRCGRLKFIGNFQERVIPLKAILRVQFR